MKFLCNIPTWLQSIALFMVALGVRLLHITATDIAGDEPFSIFMAQLDIGSIIEHLSKDNSPPIFEILLHYYMLMAGSSDFALRLFPTILNSLIVIPIFLIGKRFFNLRVAATAALMFIFCIYHIRFAHEIRVYSLFSLVFASNIYFLLSAIQKPNRKVYWIALLVTNLLLLYSHYTSFYILLAQSVCIGLFVPKQYWKYALVTLVLTVIGYSPYLLVFINRLGQVSGTGTWVPTPGWGEIYGNINLILNSKITTVFVLVSVVLGLAISLKQKAVHELVKATKNSFGLSLFILFGFTYVPMFFVSVFFLPMFMDRYVLYTSIPLFLSIAWAVDFLWSSHRYQWIGS
ncbi:MAG: glycosyltransferase family 39 protein, partial [Flavobacteriales bacterium]